MDRMPGVAVTEVVLDQAQVMALVGQIVAAAMAKHVRPDISQIVIEQLRLVLGFECDFSQGFCMGLKSDL